MVSNVSLANARSMVLAKREEQEVASVCVTWAGTALSVIAALLALKGLYVINARSISMEPIVSLANALTGSAMTEGTGTDLAPARLVGAESFAMIVRQGLQETFAPNAMKDTTAPNATLASTADLTEAAIKGETELEAAFATKAGKTAQEYVISVR